jgi:hypothetical protein
MGQGTPDAASEAAIFNLREGDRQRSRRTSSGLRGDSRVEALCEIVDHKEAQEGTVDPRFGQ